MLSICQCRVRLGRTTLRHIVLHSEEKRSKYLLNLSHQSTRIYLNVFFFCSASNVELGDVICIIKRAIYKREQRRGKIGLRRYANNKASGEPTHPRSLARSFAVCLELYQGLLLVKAYSKASGEPVHLCSLASSFTVCFHKQ